jgi:CDP-6-deoxy-D-xylo-4-hexulose-3-dehydrase
LEIRRRNAQMLTEKLSDLADYLILPIIKDGVKPSWFGYLISVKEGAPFTKQEMVEYLEAHGIGTRQLFAGNILRQPMFVDDEQVQFRIGGSKLLNSSELSEEWYSKLPNTDFIMNNTFWVGTFPALGEEEISRIAYAIHACIKEKAGVVV